MTVKIETQTPIVDFDNTQLTHGNGCPATFRTIVIECLLSRRPTDEEPLKVLELYRLASKIHLLDVFTPTPDEARLIRERVLTARNMHILAAGRVVDLLDGRYVKQAVLEAIAGGAATKGTH